MLKAIAQIVFYVMASLVLSVYWQSISIDLKKKQEFVQWLDETDRMDEEEKIVYYFTEGGR